MTNNSEYKIQLYTTSLMLMIASSDNNVENDNNVDEEPDFDTEEPDINEDSEEY